MAPNKANLRDTDLGRHRLTGWETLSPQVGPSMRNKANWQRGFKSEVSSVKLDNHLSQFVVLLRPAPGFVHGVLLPVALQLLRGRQVAALVLHQSSGDILLNSCKAPFARQTSAFTFLPIGIQSYSPLAPRMGPSASEERRNRF